MSTGGWAGGPRTWPPTHATTASARPHAHHPATTATRSFHVGHPFYPLTRGPASPPGRYKQRWRRASAKPPSLSEANPDFVEQKINVSSRLGSLVVSSRLEAKRKPRPPPPSQEGLAAQERSARRPADSKGACLLHPSSPCDSRPQSTRLTVVDSIDALVVCWCGFPRGKLMFYHYVWTLG
jgi:hypothetical protein